MSDDFIQMSEYIEIKFMPDGIVDLAEFISTLEAINTEYRQWLRDHNDHDHLDRDLRLQLVKIDEGSIVVWLAKTANLTFIVLEQFFKQKLQNAIVSLIDKEMLSNFSVNSLKNYRRITRFKLKARYVNPINGNSAELELDGEKVEAIKTNISDALSADESHTKEFENTTIRVTGFHIERPAQVIAAQISEGEIKSFLTPEVRSYFVNQEEQNFLTPNKEYLANLEATYAHNELNCYLIKKILGS